MLTNREKVMRALVEQSRRMDSTSSLGITANEIADNIGIQRSTVSLYLNELAKSNDAIKMNTRPVYFIDRHVYEQDRQKYTKINAFLRQNAKDQTAGDPFSSLIGIDGSLKNVVEQVKSSVIYPPNGLPCLLVGDSGVGKSMIAHLAYLYAKKEGFCSGNWVVLNCAEYANNPELLSSMLFGHVKGAFTGADSEKIGLLETAQNGYLFLDEVHRLAPENQEKLFQFMDKGIYRKVGETRQSHTSNARLIFATTERENPDFLQTFLRRIPLVVQIPNFQERSGKEKIALISTLFLKEAKTIKKNLNINSQVVQLLLNNVTKGNIGKLSNIIKLSCAKVLLNGKAGAQDRLEIKIEDLPEDFIKQQGAGANLSDKDRSIQINYEDAEVTSKNTSESDRLYDFAGRITRIINALELKDGINKKASDQLSELSNQIIDYISFELTNSRQTVLTEYIESAMKSVLSNMYLNFGLNQFNSGTNLLTKLVIYINNYEDGRTVDNLIEACMVIKRKYNNQYKLCLMLVDALKHQFTVKNEMLYCLFLFDFLFSQESQLISREINAVIISHGYSTASSIATTVNRLLKNYVFEGFDMPLEATVSDILRKLKEYLKTIDNEKDLIILVDMGSLTKIQDQLKAIYAGNIGIITNVTTQIALVAGSKILNNEAFEKIVKETTAGVVPEYALIHQEKKQSVILTTCIAGIGATKYLQELVKKNTNGEIPIITEDYYRLKENGINDDVFKNYHVKMIIGTDDDPEIEGIPYLSVEGLINRRVGDPIFRKAFPKVFNNENLEKMNKNVIKAFTVDSIASNLSILNPEQTVDQVEYCVRKMERSLGTKLDVYLKVSLYMHLCFMMERIILKEPNLDYPDLDNLRQCYGHFIRIVKDALSEIQHYYQIEIPDSEIGFIYDILKNRIKIRH
jgi:Transcriptional antiterminator